MAWPGRRRERLHVGVGVVGAFADHGFGERKAVGHDRDGSLLRHDQILGVASISPGSQPEHAVARLERGHPRPHRLDLAGEVHPQDGPARPQDPGEQADEERMRPQSLPVGAADGAGHHPHQDVARPGLGCGHVPDLDGVGSAVAGVDGGSHCIGSLNDSGPMGTARITVMLSKSIS